MENLKNIAPVEGFDWEAYEKGDVLTNVSHEELEKLMTAPWVRWATMKLLKVP